MKEFLIGQSFFSSVPPCIWKETEYLGWQFQKNYVYVYI